MRGSSVVSGIIVVTVVLAACTGGDGEAPNGSGEDAPTAAASGAAGALDACEVLRAVDLTPFIGPLPHSYDESVQNASGDFAVSLCLAAPEEGVPLVSLMLRRDPEGPDPRSRQEYIDEEIGADIADMGPDEIAELQGAEEVGGLGDYALAYRLFGQQLAVYWKGEFYLMASTTGVRDGALARQAVEVVAREAVARH